MRKGYDISQQPKERTSYTCKNSLIGAVDLGSHSIFVPEFKHMGSKRSNAA